MTLTINPRIIRQHATNVYNVSDAFGTPLASIDSVDNNALKHAFGKLCAPILMDYFEDAVGRSRSSLTSAQTVVAQHGAAARKVTNEFLGLDEINADQIATAGDRVFGVRTNQISGAEPGSPYEGRKPPTGPQQLIADTDHGGKLTLFHAPGVVPNPILPPTAIPVTTKNVPYGFREGGDTFGSAENGASGGLLEGAGFLYNAAELHRSIAAEDTNWKHAIVMTGSMIGDATDPIGALLSGMNGWIMDHIEPFPTYLDWLAGDADECTAIAQTWVNIGGEVGRLGDDLHHYLGNDLAVGVKTRAFDAYKVSLGNQINVLAGYELLCAGLGQAINQAGTMVDTVRSIVRDLAAEAIAAVQKVAVRMMGVPIGQINDVYGTVMRLAAQAYRYITRLSDALRRLTPLLKAVIDGIDKAGHIWKNGLPNTDDKDALKPQVYEKK